MAEMKEVATVELRVNDKQFAAKMDTLQQKADNLQAKIDMAAKEYDLETEKKLRKELAKTEQEMRKMQTTAQQIDYALKHLDTATPKELRKLIAAINKELDSGTVRRGTKEWDEYNEQLRAAKKELEEIRKQQQVTDDDQSWLGKLGDNMKQNGALKDAVEAASALFTGFFDLLQGDLRGAMSSFKQFYTIVAKNPIGLAVAAVVGLAAGFVKLNKEMDEQYKLENAQAEINKRSTEEYNKRKDSIDELRKLMPEYAAALEKEGKLYTDNAEALRRYNETLALYTKYTATRDEYKQAVEQMEQLQQVARANAGPNMTGATWFINKQTEANLDAATEKVNKLRESMNMLWFEYRRAAGGQGNTYKPSAPSTPTAPTTPTNKTEDPTQAALKAIEAQTVRQEAIIRAQYATGVIDYRQYQQQMYQISEEGLTAKMALYDQDSKEYLELLAKNYENAVKYGEETQQLNLQQLQQRQQAEQVSLQQQFLSGQLSLQAYNQQRAQMEMDAIRQRMALHEAGSAEYLALEQQLNEKLVQDRTAKQQQYEQNMATLRQQFAKTDAEQQKTQYISMLDELHQLGLVSEEEYQQMLEAIRQHYADANKQRNLEMLNQFMSSAMSMLSAYSSFISASEQAEVASVTRKYDEEIEAAGKNSAKAKSLEKKKQKDIARIKNEYSKRSMGIEIAQALASTAMAAINAYASASKVAFWLGPVAAAAAVAAGMLQVAAIRKQHEAMSEGYYEGGFTPAIGSREVAGVVHGGEFVANHQAVNNPDISPVLSLIDYAQRHNSVAQLSSADIIRAAQATGDTAAQSAELAAAVGILTSTTDRQNAVIDRLQLTLDRGIHAFTTIEGPQGFNAVKGRYDYLIERT